MGKTTVFVFSGPGGVGKTTLVQKLFRSKKIRDNFIRSVSATTRAQRPGEKDGKDYLFLEKADFLAKEKAGYFLETEKVLENYYGTPRYFLDQAEKEKKSLILCIDVKGGMYLKKTVKQSRIVTVFITAPRKQDLLKRLENRAEDQKVIKQRIALAKTELSYLKKYDHVVVNREVEKAAAEIRDILLEETGGNA